MINHSYPITIVDNFFDDPFEVIKLAEQQEYRIDAGGRYPGKRTVHVGDFAPNFFNKTITKFFSIFYNLENIKYQYHASMHFQKVGIQYDDGWIHADNPQLISGIVYLNTNSSLNSGTSICMPNSVDWVATKNLDTKIESFLAEKDHTTARSENNDQFHETVIVKNKFNRLIAFDSHLAHKANFELMPNNTERLTLVFFVENFITTELYPLTKMRRM